MNCRLCDFTKCEMVFSDDFRRYHRCKRCGLIFVSEQDIVGVEEEKKRYDLHENSPDHAGYVRFLNELVFVIIEHYLVSRRILDYGSGRHAVVERKGV